MSWLSEILGQDSAKQAAGQANTAVQTAQDIYGGLAPYRTAAQGYLLSPTSSAGLQDIYGQNPAYTAINNPILNQANAVASGTLGNLTTSAPDYAKEAETTLTDLQNTAAPQLAAALKQVQDAAGASGKIGSEGVTSSLGDIYDTYAQNLLSAEDQLATQATQQGQQNALNTLGAAEGLGSQAYSQSAADRALADQLAEQGITNTAAEQGQQFGQGLSLAGLGYSNNPVSSYFQAAGINNANANTAAGTAGNLFKGLGDLAMVAAG